MTNTKFSDAKLNSAHRIQDMLLWCSWQVNEECDYLNFTLTVTDWGVCYTFNNPLDKEEVLKVKNPGSRYCLFMRLNVEQYEYTASENTGAGLKVGNYPFCGLLRVFNLGCFSISYTATLKPNLKP